jgi:hypothetical protein
MLVKSNKPWIHPPNIRPPVPFPDHVKNEEVLLRVKERRSTLQTISKRKANWTGYILYRNCLLKHVFEGKIEGRSEWKKRKMKCSY